jgi:hypothetical protein
MATVVAVGRGFGRARVGITEGGAEEAWEHAREEGLATWEAATGDSNTGLYGHHGVYISCVPWEEC